MIMLNEKETMFLKDEKKHEQLCIDKYNEYAQKATDVELKNLFASLAQKEQHHLQTINEMLSGKIPNINSSSSGAEQNSKVSNVQSQNSNISNNANIQNSNQSLNSDKMLCEDSLATEKYVSSTYDTTIFEFRDANARQVLNHIQKEEQEHGQKIYNYMNQHGMYN